MIKGLRAIIAKLQEATGQIMSAGNEILAASQQQASAAREQSSAVTETTAAAKELSTTSESVGESIKKASRRVEAGLVQTAGLVNYTVAIFIGMGFIIVGLLKTGVAAGLTGWISHRSDL